MTCNHIWHCWWKPLGKRNEKLRYNLIYLVSMDLCSDLWGWIFTHVYLHTWVLIINLARLYSLDYYSWRVWHAQIFKLNSIIQSVQSIYSWVCMMPTKSRKATISNLTYKIMVAFYFFFLISADLVVKLLFKNLFYIYLLLFYKHR